MNDLLLLLGGITIGTYFAEPIRKTVPLLDPSPAEDSESQTAGV